MKPLRKGHSIPKEDGTHRLRTNGLGAREPCKGLVTHLIVGGQGCTEAWGSCLTPDREVGPWVLPMLLTATWASLGDGTICQDGYLFQFFK